MVVFPPSCTPRVLDAYPTMPLLPSVRTSIIHDYNVGSFARFQNPTSVISIHDRPDLYSLSHLEIRQRLDTEGHDNVIVIIDSATATNHAVWFVLSTAESAFFTDLGKDMGYPPIEYPGEVPLWKLHILTQHLPLEYDFLQGGGKPIWEDVSEPYDSHDPQEPPLSMGVDFSKKEDAMSNAWYAMIGITASAGEYVFSDDPTARAQPQFGQPPPPYVVSLTGEAARGAGLLVEWVAWRDPLPGEGESVRLTVHYDWDSPRWAWDGGVGGNGSVSGGEVERNESLGMGCRVQMMNAGLELPLVRNGRLLNNSVSVTA